MKEIVKKRRLELGLTQEQVAYRAGVTYRTYHQFEHGTAKTKLETVQKILGALGITIGLDMSSEPQNAPRIDYPEKNYLGHG